LKITDVGIFLFLFH